MNLNTGACERRLRAESIQGILGKTGRHLSNNVQHCKRNQVTLYDQVCLNVCYSEIICENLKHTRLHKSSMRRAQAEGSIFIRSKR